MNAVQALNARHGAPQARPIVQVVAPGVGGVRDHAERLQTTWRSVGRTCALLTLRDADLVGNSLERLGEDALSREYPNHRPTDLMGATLLLHFSGYGYHRRGLCLNLAEASAKLSRATHRRSRLVTFFHESFASGPPWRTAFWLSPIQARVAGRIARASDVVLTNSSTHAQWLSRFRADRCEVPVWPVFATVGEPAADGSPALRRYTERQPLALLFGAESTRERVACVLRREAERVQALRRLGVESLVEVGGGNSTLGESVSGMRSSFLGRLDEVALHDLLARCRFGLLEYPDDLLGKSSVFAAYAAHGLVPVNLAPRRSSADGASAGLQFIGLDRKAGASLPPATAFGAVAAAAHDWYRSHDLSVQSEAFVRHCDG